MVFFQPVVYLVDLLIHFYQISKYLPHCLIKGIILPGRQKLLHISQTRLPAESHLSLVWLQTTGNNFKKGGFTTAVHSHQPHMGIIVYLKIYVVKKAACHKGHAQFMACCNLHFFPRYLRSSLQYLLSYLVLYIN